MAGTLPSPPYMSTVDGGGREREGGRQRGREEGREEGREGGQVKLSCKVVPIPLYIAAAAVRVDLLMYKWRDVGENPYGWGQRLSVIYTIVNSRRPSRRK